MHVMFLHPNFPAQFGHIANHLALNLGWKCTFVTSVDTTHLQLPFDHINYKLDATKPQPKTFYNPDNLQGHLDHLVAVYSGLRTVPQLKPDLVVGHTSYGTMLYLRNLYDCPFLGYFELLPPAFWGDGLILRKEYPPPEGVRLFNAIYHSLTYLHLHACEALYTPTHFQLTTAPTELQHKVRVNHDGIDMEFNKRHVIPRPWEYKIERPPEPQTDPNLMGPSYSNVQIGPNTRVVTYVARGLESLRGFDIFIKVAKNIAREIDDVVFLIAGDTRTNYGHEMHTVGHVDNPYRISSNQPSGQMVSSPGAFPTPTYKYASFREFIWETELKTQPEHIRNKFKFLNLIPTHKLIELYSLSDLHFYLTAPFVLSWSLVQAMSSGCTLLGSRTAPVEEAIDHGVHGFLADFYDVDEQTRLSLEVLRDPEAHRHMGVAARARVAERYELKQCTESLVKLMQDVASGYRSQKYMQKVAPMGIQ